MPGRDVHAGGEVLQAGAGLEEAAAAVVLVHGRGGTARAMLELVPELGAEGQVAYLAPQASGGSWYPLSFLAPLDRNEPDLSSALRRLEEIVGRIERAGLSVPNVLLLGFSQGACLALEYVARNARAYGGAVGWSGGLIGPDGTPRDYAGSLQGCPVFIGCSDRDPHIPLRRVRETTSVFRTLGATVTERIYPGLGHAVNAEEIRQARAMIGDLAAAPG